MVDDRELCRSRENEILSPKQLGLWKPPHTQTHKKNLNFRKGLFSIVCRPFCCYTFHQLLNVCKQFQKKKTLQYEIGTITIQRSWGRQSSFPYFFPPFKPRHTQKKKKPTPKDRPHPSNWCQRNSREKRNCLKIERDDEEWKVVSEKEEKRQQQEWKKDPKV